VNKIGAAGQIAAVECYVMFSGIKFF
jgi:hypothetical protein